MGLDASVMCTCYQRGLVRIPLELKNKLVVEEENLWLIEAYENNRELNSKFYRWKKNVCEHDDMDYWVGHISHWRGVREFQSLLTQKPHKFITLLKEIPNSNAGYTSPEAAKTMQEELQTLNELSNWGNKHVLVDTETNREVWNWIQGNNKFWILNGSEGIDLGIDRASFFIQNHSSGEYLFRSNNFQQILEAEEDIGKHQAMVLFRDYATEKTFRCSSGILRTIATSDRNLKTQREHIPRLHTEWRERNLQEYQYIINSLTAACQACLETGNPIRWT